MRVGGGFLPIEEFIRIYTEPEIAKIERRNVVDRFQNKIKAQQIILSRTM